MTDQTGRHEGNGETEQREGGSEAEQREGGSEAERRERGDEADRVVVSYPEDLSDWGRATLEESPFRAYLRKRLDAVEPGDTVDEFVGVGCCGDTLDVPLRIEAIEGGERVGETTEIAYEVREAAGVEGGWRVQSAGGPTE